MRGLLDAAVLHFIYMLHIWENVRKIQGRKRKTKDKATSLRKRCHGAGVL